MDNHELAHALFPKRDEGAPRILYGKAVSDSKDGVVSVDVGGQVMQMPTDGNIKRGERTTVTLQDGMVAALGAQGAGDRVQEDVEGAKSAANTANTTANNLSTIIREDSSGVTVGKSTDGGKTYSGSRSTLGSSGLTIKDESGTQLASFGASEVDIGKNSKTAQIKLAGNSVIFGRYGTGNSSTSIDSVDGVYIMAPYNKPLALVPYHTNNNGTKVLDDAGVGVVNDKVVIIGPTEIRSTNLTINGRKVNPYGSTITMASGWTNRDSQVRVSGYIVNIWLNVDVTHAADPAVGSLIATIPSSLAPAVEQDFAGAAWTDTPDRAWVTVTTSGQIRLKQYYGGGTGQIKCSMTYVMKG